MINVEQWIKSNAICHDDDVTYDDDGKKLNLLHWPTKKYASKGVYFFVYVRKDGSFDIQKVGKADGAFGFYTRFSTYNSHNKLANSRVMKSAFEKLQKKYGKNASMQIWCHEVDSTETIDHLGWKVSPHYIRDLEQQISAVATKQGHSMFMSVYN